MNGVDDIALTVRDQLCIDCVCTFRDGCGCTDTIAAAIEAAILAERERAARISENAAKQWEMYDCFERASEFRDIAAAIRGA